MVTDLLSGGLLRVELDREVVTAHVAEEFARVSVPLRTGDRVKVRRTAQDSKRGTIVDRAGERS